MNGPEQDNGAPRHIVPGGALLCLAGRRLNGGMVISAGKVLPF